MHVLIIPSWYPHSPNEIGGSFFREQALALRKHGCKVGVITLQLRSLRNWRSLLTGRYGTTFENDLGVLTYRKHGMAWFTRMPRLMAWLWKKNLLVLFDQYIEKHGKPDVIHVHSILYAGWAAKVISDKYHVPYVVTEHSSAFARYLVSPVQKIMTEQVATSAKKRFAVSKSFAGYLSTYLEVNNCPWEVMPNIVHESFFSSQIETRDERESFTFINVALLTPNKGGRFLIKAFANALASQLDMKLKIGGDGSERAALVKLTQELGVENNVEFLGMLSRNQVVDQIVTSDAFVLSSQYETFGVVVIEALALGKPVIATRCGGPEDLIYNDNGILVPVNDVDALAAAMLNIYNNRDSYNSQKIRSDCNAQYSEKVIAERLMQLYSDVQSENI